MPEMENDQNKILYEIYIFQLHLINDLLFIEQIWGSLSVCSLE